MSPQLYLLLFRMRFPTTDAQYLRRLHGCQQYPLNSLMSSLFRMHSKRRMHDTTGKCLKAQRASQSIMPRTRDAVRPSRSSALDDYTPRLRILLCARSRTRSPGRSPSHIAGGKWKKPPANAFRRWPEVVRKPARTPPGAPCHAVPHARRCPLFLVGARRPLPPARRHRCAPSPDPLVRPLLSSVLLPTQTPAGAREL